LDILIVVPVVLAVGVYWLEGRQREGEQAIEDQRAQQRMQDAALQEYFNQIGQLLLDKQLRGSEEGDEVRALARSGTLAILDNLDATRKRHLLQFLYEARLIYKEGRVVPLDGANLRDANLRYITLEGAALDGAILENTDLRGADLRGDELVNAHLHRKEKLNLRGADLTGANLADTNLAGANLSDATVTEAQLASCYSLATATMPDGSVHD
jgi:hypothetical protein